MKDIKQFLEVIWKQCLHLILRTGWSFVQNGIVSLRIWTLTDGLHAKFWKKSLNCYSSFSKSLLGLNNSSHVVRPSPPQQRWMGRSSLHGLSNGREAPWWEPPIGPAHDRSGADWWVLGHICKETQNITPCARRKHTLCVFCQRPRAVNPPKHRIFDQSMCVWLCARACVCARVSVLHSHTHTRNYLPLNALSLWLHFIKPNSCTQIKALSTFFSQKSY